MFAVAPTVQEAIASCSSVLLINFFSIDVSDNLQLKPSKQESVACLHLLLFNASFKVAFEADPHEIRQMKAGLHKSLCMQFVELSCAHNVMPKLANCRPLMKMKRGRL